MICNGKEIDLLMMIYYCYLFRDFNIYSKHTTIFLLNDNMIG
jgi:hypothetical protein